MLLAEASGADGFTRKVVIKRVLPQFSASEEFITMFRDEARLTGGLHHGNIVQVVEFGEQDGQFHLVLEYVNGPSLGTLLGQVVRRGGRLAPRVALHVATEVARALDYAHRKRGADGLPLQLVHRDVTPSNVLLSLEGEVKLADFGIARAQSRVGVTQQGAGVVKGKLPYMAPETLQHGVVDARSDLYALGVVLYEMLAGVRPYTGDTDAHVLTQILAGQPVPLSERAPNVPPRVAELVARLMAVEPQDRPGRGQDVVEVLVGLMTPGAQTPAEELATLISANSDAAAPATVQEEATPSVAPPSSRWPVLLLDDSRALRSLLRLGLGTSFHVHEAATPDEAVALAAAVAPRAVVLQRSVRGRDWRDVVADMRAAAGDTLPVVVLLASDVDPSLQALADEAGVARVLSKAAAPRELQGVLTGLLSDAH